MSQEQGRTTASLLSRLHHLAGTVLLLEGPPHGGKALIQEAIQRLDNRVWFRMGVDQLCREIVPALAGEEGIPQARNLLDPLVHDNLEALHLIIASMARAGCDVVVDYLPLAGEHSARFPDMLTGLDVFRVRLTCPEDVIRTREAELGPKPEGTWEDLAPALALEDAAQRDPYDLTVDGSGDPDAAARSILNALYAREMLAEPLARVVSTSFPQPVAEKPGRIIMLNGTSSAGKSTLNRAVQQLAAKENLSFLNVGIDLIAFALHSRFIDASLTNESMPDGNQTTVKPEGWIGFKHIVVQPEPDPRLQQQLGPAFRLGLCGQVAAAAALSRAGYHVIGDHVIYYEDWYTEAAEAWTDLPTLWVLIDADPADLVAHEKARGDRNPGVALGCRDQMFKGIPYDLEINTSHQEPDEEAITLLEKIRAMKVG